MKKRLILFLFTMLTSVSAWAEDFVVDGIYYAIESLSDLTVSVSCCGKYYYSYSNEYSGAIVIPSTVSRSGKTYSVTSIRYEAFRDCSGLTSVEIPSSVTSIGSYAFYNCSALKNVTIPESVMSIGNSAFGSCRNLTSVTIPKRISSIGNDTFRDCIGLTSMTIPEGVTSIGNYAFYGCSGLTDVAIPQSVTSIGEQAFSFCSSLVNLTIPQGATTISKAVFSGCTGLTSVDIPNSVTSIGEYAFSGCTSLISITIPEGVTDVGKSAFLDCSSLISVYFNADKCTNMGDYFSGPVFNRCYSLTEITIGNNVQVIPPDAFYGCSGLISLTIPEGVTEVGKYAFSRCSGLTNVTFNNSIPPSLDWLVFYDNENFNIYVPKDAVDTYKEALSEYADIIFAIPTPTAVESIDAEKSQKVIKTIEDGKIVIIRNGVKWDLSGKKIDMK